MFTCSLCSSCLTEEEYPYLDSTFYHCDKCRCGIFTKYSLRLRKNKLQAELFRTEKYSIIYVYIQNTIISTQIVTEEFDNTESDSVTIHHKKIIELNGYHKFDFADETKLIEKIDKLIAFK